MNFGLRNAVLTFQRFLDQVVQGLKCVVEYVVDILVTSPSRKQHEEHLRQLFTRLQQYGLRIHPFQCLFGAQGVDFSVTG